MKEILKIDLMLDFIYMPDSTKINAAKTVKIIS